MRAVDTNVLVRIVTGDDPRQTKQADAFVADGAWVSHIVLAEACWVLGSRYGEPPARVAGAVEMLLTHELLTLQDPDVVVAALARFRDQPKVGFTDCLVLEIARKSRHLPLGTFDRTFAKLNGVQQVGT